ncbi:hypothetical protein ACIBCT_35770 [Streptosporangium sp. NPDC050855]|uniref:hypothetical protein n=1 Tax=Streptosporangium sp. NPDC050855 TaxID=3366194 RepID=UPI0037B0766F
MDWWKDGEEDVDLGVGMVLSSHITYLAGFADTDAVVRWNSARPWHHDFLVEVSAKSWESWAGIRPGKTRRDVIDYVTYNIPYGFAALEQTKAQVTWKGITPVDYSTPEKRHELLFRWPTMRMSE